MQALQFVWIMLMMLIGLVAVIAAHLAYRAPVARAEEEPPVEFPRDIRQGHGPIPVLMWLLYIAIACTLVIYTLWVWKAHPNI